MKARLLPLLLAALLPLSVAACSATPKVADAPAPSAAADADRKFRTQYDRGLERIAAALPPAKDGDAYEPLRGLLRFRREAVSWAAVENGSYMAIDAGYDRGGWLAIAPRDYAKTMPSSLMMDSSASIAVIVIAPERVTESWAGLFLMHELVHLYDRVSGREAAGASRTEFLAGELRAYEVELLAADLLSRGSFSRAIDAKLGSWASLTPERIVQKALDLTLAEQQQLTGTLKAGPSLSSAERQLRHGFLVTAMLVRHLRRSPQSESEVLAAIDSLMQAMRAASAHAGN